MVTPVPGSKRSGRVVARYRRDVKLSIAAMRPARAMRNISVATRLAAVVVVVALVSVIVTSYVGVKRASDLADFEISDRLSGLGAARADEVERYLSGLRSAAIGQALSPRAAKAITEFSRLYDELQTAGATNSERAAVDAYYRDVAAPRLSIARDRSVSAASLLPVSDAAIALQAAYVVPDSEDRPSRDVVPGWSALHDPLQQSFAEFVDRTGLDDFYLISEQDRVVVFSTAKDIDFGTSLRSGPHSGGSLAALIRTISEAPEAGVAMIRDLAPYAPAGDSPAGFVASPVYAAGEVVGYVAARFGPDTLTAMMTDDGNWDGFGASGETYLVAADGSMRSDARGFLEDEQTYVADVQNAAAATDDQIRSMKLFGMTTFFQPVQRPRAMEVFTDGSEVVDTTNYLGTNVRSATRPLGDVDVDWVVFAEADTEEIHQPIDDFIRNLLIAIAVFIVLVTFLAVRWADRLVEPLRVMSTRLRGIHTSGDVSEESVAPDAGAREFVELSDDITTVLATLRSRSLAAARTSEERRALMRRLLPPQMAERAEEGDRDVVDEVPSATVAVVVLHGLGAMMASSSAEQARRFLDEVIEHADDLAEQRGLDRIRLTGDAYFAACGLTRPHLDHAARAVAFVLDVRELVDDLDAVGGVEVTAGLASGPVSVGLTGGPRLMHDTWGATVQRAGELARIARPGDILVAASVRSQLPDRYQVVATDVDGASCVVGRVPANEDAS